MALIVSTTPSRSQVLSFWRLLPPPHWPPSLALACYLFVLGEWIPSLVMSTDWYCTADSWLVLTMGHDAFLAVVLAACLLSRPLASCHLVCVVGLASEPNSRSHSRVLPLTPCLSASPILELSRPLWWIMCSDWRLIHLHDRY